MTLDMYPVYRKDLRLLSKQAVTALLLQPVLMILIPIVLNARMLAFDYASVFRYALSASVIRDFFPKIQIAITALIALAAAAQWSAEERAGQHDRFLRRLAASRTRVWGEKTAAGLTIVLGVILVQYLCQSIALMFGLEIWYLDDPVGLYILVIGITSYLVGLPLSCLFKQTLQVVLVGLVIEFSGLWLYASIGQHSIASIRWAVFILIAVLIVAPAISMLPGSRSGISPLPAGIISSKRENRSKIRAIVDKQLRENLFMYIIALILSVCGFFLANDEPLTFETYRIIFLAVMFIHLAVLGVCVYNADDKDAARCVLYHHPISRSTLFWTKFLTGLIPALILAFSITVLVNGLRVLHFRHLPAVTISAAACLLPYLCGLFATCVFRNSLYAALAAIILTPRIGAFLEDLLFSFEHAYNVDSGSHSFQRISDVPFLISTGMQFPGFSLFRFCTPWFLLMLGLVLAAWIAMRDRTLFAEGTFYRFVYMTRLLLFVIAVTLILTRVGWLDLFYLITSIDLGIG